MTEEASVVYKKVKKLVLFFVHVSKKGARACSLDNWHCFYSLYCREGVFSETELPVFSILGNSGMKRAGAVRPRPDTRCLLSASCWVVGSLSLLPLPSLRPPPPTSSAAWSCICLPLPLPQQPSLWLLLVRYSVLPR